MEETVSQRLSAVLEPEKLTILTFTTDLVPRLKLDTNQRRLALSFNNYCYIDLDSSLLPFLTVEENFFVGIKRKQMVDYAKQLFQWQHFFKMETSINQAYPNDLGRDRLVIIQLIRAFVLEKKYVFIDDLELELSEEFLISLIPILKKISRELKISIVLLTTKDQLSTQFNLETIKAHNIL